MLGKWTGFDNKSLASVINLVALSLWYGKKMSSLSERSKKVTQRSGIGVGRDYVKKAKEKVAWPHSTPQLPNTSNPCKLLCILLNLAVFKDCFWQM